MTSNEPSNTKLSKYFRAKNIIFFIFCVVNQSLVIIVIASLVSAICLVTVIIAVMVLITVSVCKRKKRNQQHEVESIDYNNIHNIYMSS